MKRAITAVAIVALTAAVGYASGPPKLDPALQAYKSVSGVSGNVSSIGSDTLNNLMTLWAENFSKFYPNAKIQIEGKGSSTAPPALISGTAQLGPMSREMKGTEVDAFEKKYGYKPTPIRTSVDALAVFVNKDNPIKCMTIAQADAVFSKSRRHGYKEDITTWGQLGLTGEWANKPLSLYGRNSASGTYGFFKEHTLKNGDFKDSVKEQPGSAAVVQGVTVDRFAIGLQRHRLHDRRSASRFRWPRRKGRSATKRIPTTPIRGATRCPGSCSSTSTRRQASRSSR